MKDEDFGYEQRRQARIDAENWDMKQSIPWHQKIGTKVPFSRMVDKDPWKDIPLSVPQDSPVLIEAIAWSIIAAAVGLGYWWVV
jgi:hypothetical protein